MMIGKTGMKGYLNQSPVVRGEAGASEIGWREDKTRKMTRLGAVRLLSPKVTGQVLKVDKLPKSVFGSLIKWS